MSLDDIGQNLDVILYEMLTVTMSKSASVRSAIGMLYADLIGNNYLPLNLVLSL